MGNSDDPLPIPQRKRKPRRFHLEGEGLSRHGAFLGIAYFGFDLRPRAMILFAQL